MSLNFKEFKSLFIPSDIMPIGMVVIGIIISFFISEIAIKLIGISISILGIVVLLMKLTTRLSSSVQTKFKSNPPPNFKITVKKSPEAVRQVIENYSGEIEDKTEQINNQKEEIVKEQQKVEKNTMGEEEGFRIIKKEKEQKREFENLSETASSTKDQKTIDKGNNKININTEKNKDSDIKSSEVSKSKNKVKYNSPSKFRKREINFPTQGLLEEMPILKEHPDKEFEFFINRILMAIRSVSNTRTAAYFFYNEYKNEIILNSYATESKSILNKKSKFVAGNDIVSQIARSMKPEILTDINPAAEIDLLPYYNSNSGTNSFIGIPVIYDKKVIGVLTADSKHSDAYDTVMVNFLSHFAKLISGLIRSYSDKYDLAQDSKYLNVINELESLNTTDVLKIQKELVKNIETLFNTKNVYSIGLNGNNSDFIINATANSKNTKFKEGFVFSNESSILSEAIKDNNDIYLSNPDSDLVRISIGEDMSYGYFYLIPLSTNIDNYGAIAIEGKENLNLDRSEKLFLKSIVGKTARLIQNSKLVDIIKKGLDKDPESGLLSEKSIKVEVEKEIERISNFKFQSSLVSICFDKYKSIDNLNDSVNDKILLHVNNTLETTLDKLDLKGKINNNILVLLPGKNAQAAKLWSERIRNKIANESLYLSDKRCNITVSVGICELHNNSNFSDILKNVNTALNVSKEKTNTVSVYS